MSSQTKMIIITSDEDIIRQFSIKNNKNTHIIDLDNNKQIISTSSDNNNIINLDCLAQLSELNSNNDQVYKRALDSSDHLPSKSVKTPKRSNDMICRICDDRAIGYNYDVLSCASCKVFFRRNADLDLEKIKCLTGEYQCSVTYGIRRRCKRCRLNRCFTMGMRKDFLLSEEEKQQRRKRLEENRNRTLQLSTTLTTNPISNSESISTTFEENNRTSMVDDDNDDITDLYETINFDQINDTLSNTLSVDDWLTIENVRSSFVSHFEDETVQCMCIDVTDRISALITWSQFISRVTLRFINFFRQINEFEDLHFDDRFILIKYNTLALCVISKCFYYNPINDCCSYGDNELAEKRRQFFMLCDASSRIRESFVDLVLSLVETTKQDSILLSLLSIILLFSHGLSIIENEPLLQDSLAVDRAQAHYTRILWNYLVNQSDEIQACKYFTKLIALIFRMQYVGKEFLHFFRIQYITSNTVDQMAPLMQSVLHIS